MLTLVFLQIFLWERLGAIAHKSVEFLAVEMIEKTIGVVKKRMQRAPFMLRARRWAREEQAKNKSLAKVINDEKYFNYLIFLCLDVLLHYLCSDFIISDCHTTSRSNNHVGRRDDCHPGAYLATHRVGIGRGCCRLQSLKDDKATQYIQGEVRVRGDMSASDAVVADAQFIGKGKDQILTGVDKLF